MQDSTWRLISFVMGSTPNPRPLLQGQVSASFVSVVRGYWELARSPGGLCPCTDRPSCFLGGGENSLGHPAQIAGGCYLCWVPVDTQTAVCPTAHPRALGAFWHPQGRLRGAWPRGAGGLPPPLRSRGKHEQQESGQDISSACAEMDPPCRPSAPAWHRGVCAEPVTRWQWAGASLLGSLLPGPGAAARAPPAPGTVLPASLVEEHPPR